MNWQAAAVLLALVAGALLLPEIFAQFAAIAFLYVLPGYFLVKILGVKLHPLEALGLSLLCSVMVSTFAIYWLSMLLGYSTLSFALFFATVSIAALFVRGAPRLEIPEEAKAPLALAAMSALVVFLVLYFSLWVPSENGVIVGGWNYGDYFLHVSVMNSVNNGNFPPQEPVYAGEPLRYHWFIDLHTAVVSKLLNLFPSFPSVIDSSLGVGLLSLFSYLVAFHFTKDRKAALLCALLTVFGGGFGYLRLWDEAGKAPITNLIAGDAFDNKGDFFQLPSMLSGFLLAQRPLTIGLPALAAVLFLVATGYPNDRHRLLLAGIVLGLMPPFQYYAFLAAALLSALYFAYYHVSKRSARAVQNAFLFVILPSLILALPFLLEALGRAGGMTKLGLFWLAPKSNALEFVKFYVGNLGLPLLLAVPGFLLLKGKQKVFLILAVLLIFIIPNVITFSNTQWDMGKFFMCEWFLICLFAGVAVSKMPEWSWAAILLFCCLSPLLGSAFYLASGWVGLSHEEVAAGQWILANTPERAVFVSSHAHNTPIDSVGGRLRVLGYQWWVTNYGLDYDSRFNDLKALYCGPRESVPGLMEKYNATYAYVSMKEVGDYSCAPSFEGIPGFTLAYSADEIRIYRFSRTNS